MRQYAAVTATAVDNRCDCEPLTAAVQPQATQCAPEGLQDFLEEFGSAEAFIERGTALNLTGKVIALFLATALFAAYCEGRVPLSGAASAAMQEQAAAALPGVGAVR
jgi:hypothetical protein